MKLPLRIACLVSLAAILPAALTSAATKTAKFKVTATVQSDCTVAATDLAFGTVGLIESNVDATSTITITCTPHTAYAVGLNEGTVAGSRIDNRKMRNGLSTLDFQLYSNPQRTQVWGTTDGVDTVGGSGTGLATNLTVYGRIPVQNTPAAGSYSTEITATITY